MVANFLIFHKFIRKTGLLNGAIDLGLGPRVVGARVVGASRVVGAMVQAPKSLNCPIPVYLRNNFY